MTRAAAPRVLLAAYQCGPGMGSVSQIGWEWYSRLARRVPVTLITHARNRQALLASGAPLPGSEVIYVDTEWLAGPLYRTAKRLFPRSEHAVFLLSSLDFFAYDAAALRLCRKRQRRGATWDVTHAVTPVSTVAPTRLHRLGIPLVIGPLNGGLGTPVAFHETMREDAAWLYPLRNVGRLLDAACGATRNAARILVATEATRQSVPARYRGRCVAMLENGVDLERFHAAPWPAAPSASEPLRVLFVGRLVPFKGVPMLLDAVARLGTGTPVELEIVGDGPMAAAWQARAAELGLGGNVRFLGNLALEAVAERMRWAHVFCLPSVRESGGAVLLEAMACARPVLAVAFGGPAEIVDDGVGRALAPEGVEAVTAGLEAALRDCARDPAAWRARGEEGRCRAVARFGWEAKIGAALAIYVDVLDQHDGAADLLPAYRV